MKTAMKPNISGQVKALEKRMLPLNYLGKDADVRTLASLSRLISNGAASSDVMRRMLLEVERNIVVAEANLGPKAFFNLKKN